MKYIQKLIAFGYLLIALFIGCIAYVWFYEWRMIEVMEADNRQIDKFKKRDKQYPYSIYKVLFIG